MKSTSKILLITFIIQIQACDIFESREPESPDQTKSNYRTPVEPSDVIVNLINSFQDKNANDYQKNFSPGQPLFDKIFYFVPASDAQPNFPEPWTISQEFQYFNNLVISAPNEFPLQLIFTNEEYQLQADSAIFTATYTISVPVLNSEPESYEGNVKYFMAQSNTIWAIYYWEDITKQSSQSWSILKREFYL